jgi:hypothetical protein
LFLLLLLSLPPTPLRCRRTSADTNRHADHHSRAATTITAPPPRLLCCRRHRRNAGKLPLPPPPPGATDDTALPPRCRRAATKMPSWPPLPRIAFMGKLGGGDEFEKLGEVVGSSKYWMR